MKILFDVSALPVPGFISRSILELSGQGFKVMATGQTKKGFSSPFGSIPFYKRPQSGLKAIIYFIYRFIYLFSSQPARAYHLWKWTARFSPGTRIKEFNRLSIYYLARPDIIHIQWTKALLKLEYLLDHKPCPVTVSVRGTQMFVSPLDSEIESAYRKLLPLVDKFHVVSEALAELIKQYSASQVKVINPSVAVEKIPVKSNYTLHRPVQLITVTRFHWVKGINILLDALSMLDFEWELHLVSSNPLPEEYLYQLHDLGITNRVKIYTGLKHEEVLKMLPEKDIFIFPSISEGRGNALLEAMAAALPVVCADFTGASELVKHQENGWLFRNDDRDQLKLSLEMVIAVSDSVRAQKAAAAKETVAASFHTSMVVAQWKLFFMEVCP